jgi:hypothetical protein
MKALMKRWMVLGESFSMVALTILHCLQELGAKRQAARAASSKAGGGQGVHLRQKPVLPTPEPVKVATFSGTVIRSGERFALREPDGALYPLDSAGRAWQYEGEDVTVVGNIDSQTQMLHIVQIESLAA